MRANLLIVTTALLIVSSPAVLARDVPDAITYQGKVTDATGQPVADGLHSAQFRIYTASTGGSLLRDFGPTSISTVGGVFSVILQPIESSLLTGQNAWIEATYESATLPRVKIVSVPYALRAEDLSLPFERTVSGEDAFALVSAGPGTLYRGTSTGSGCVADFRISDDDNAQPVIRAETGGTGPAATFIATNALGSDPVLAVSGVRDEAALKVTNSGTGLAAEFVGGTKVGGTAEMTGFKLTTGAQPDYLLTSDSSGMGVWAPGAFWKLDGNSGTSAGTHYLGTSDSQPLELRVHGARALRFEPGSTSPNVIAGSSANSASAGVSGAAIGGGTDNNAGEFSAVGGGAGNAAGANYATVPGGNLNTAAGDYSFAAGRRAKANHQGSFVWGDSTDSDIASNRNNQFVVRAGGGLSITCGTGVLRLDDYWTHTNVVMGYSGNYIQAPYNGSVIAGGGKSGYTNTVTDNFGVVSGGQGNSAGDNGPIDATSATVAGGAMNVASQSQATVGGGSYNTASGYRSTVPGGHYNTAAGEYSFAAGRRAKASHNGAFVWADGLDYDFASGAANQFSARCTGGARFVSAVDGSGNPTAGVSLSAGGTGWGVISDRNLKTNFAGVDGKDVLERLARVPVLTWNMKSQDPCVRHIGPMAQDFAKAFAVGEDNTHINTVDADGVALAAIQGLYKLVQEQSERIKQLEIELEAMRDSR